MIPTVPHESQMTPEQRKALRRIQMLMGEHFRRSLLTVIFLGLDQKLHVQIVSNCNSESEEKDLALRTLQQIEQSSSGIIKTLSNDERRIIQ